MVVGKYVGRFLGLTIIGLPPAISFSSSSSRIVPTTRFNNVLIRISLARATVKRFSFTVSLRLFQSSRSPLVLAGARPQTSSPFLFFFFFFFPFLVSSNDSMADPRRIRARTGRLFRHACFSRRTEKLRNVSSFDTKLMATIPWFL